MKTRIIGALLLLAGFSVAGVLFLRVRQGDLRDFYTNRALRNGAAAWQIVTQDAEIGYPQHVVLHDWSVKDSSYGIGLIELGTVISGQPSMTPVGRVTVLRLGAWYGFFNVQLSQMVLAAMAAGLVVVAWVVMSPMLTRATIRLLSPALPPSAAQINPMRS